MVALSASDLAHIYKVPASTIRRWASEGRVRRYGTPTSRRYDARQVEIAADAAARRLTGTPS